MCVKMCVRGGGGVGVWVLGLFAGVLGYVVLCFVFFLFLRLLCLCFGFCVGGGVVVRICVHVLFPEFLGYVVLCL